MLRSRDSGDTIATEMTSLQDGIFGPTPVLKQNELCMFLSDVLTDRERYEVEVQNKARVLSSAIIHDTSLYIHNSLEGITCCKYAIAWSFLSATMIRPQFLSVSQFTGILLLGDIDPMRFIVAYKR